MKAHCYTLGLVLVLMPLLLPVAGFGQLFDIKSFQVDGQNTTLKGKLTYPPQEVELSGGKIVVNLPQTQISSLNFSLVLATDPANSFQEWDVQFNSASANLKLTPDPGSMGKLCGVDLLNLSSIDSPSSTSISIRIRKKGTGEEVVSAAITVNFVPPGIFSDISDCKNKKLGEDRISCLEGLKANAGTNQIRNKIDQAIIALKNERQTASQEVNRFQIRDRENSYTLSCSNCSPGNYDIRALSGNPAVSSSGSGWKIKITKDSRIEIKHKVWPSSAVRTISLEFKSDKPAIEPVPEPEEPAVDTFVPEVVTLDTLAVEDTLPDFASQFWSDSIQELLSLVNAFSNPELQERLGRYVQMEDSEPGKKLLAYCILFRYILLGALLLLGFWAITRSGKNKKTPAATELVPESAAAVTDAPPMREEEVDISIDEIDVALQETTSTRPPFADLAGSKDYLRLDLQSCWRDTAVKLFFIKKESVRDIAQMLRQHNPFPYPGNNIEEMPEIGGFLLGHVYEKNNTGFDISVEKFVPITPESQNRYTVKFGDKAWVELHDAMKTHSGLKLVGWFHTHPGHGLFLSEADLREHTLLFKERYQVAFEIDPTTPKTDMAIFSWTVKGGMNNREQRQLSRWWSFLELRQSL